MLFFLAATPALRIEGTQGSIGAWSVRGAASRQHLRGQTANIPLGAARINRPDAVNTEEAPLQGDVQAWAVRGAAARDQLRGQNHGDASFSGGVQQTKPVYKAMTGNSEEAHPQAAPVQGNVLAWSVRGAAARNQLRGGQDASEATRDIEATLPMTARTGNSEDAHPQAAPVQV